MKVGGGKKDIQVDLKSALKEIKLSDSKTIYVGHVVAIVTPTVVAHYPNKWEQRPLCQTWIQCTRTGLDVLPGVNSFTVWVTDILTCTCVFKQRN